MMACHNREATVSAAVRSVLTQSHRDLELIACDDGSTDGTLAILREHAAADPRLRVFELPHRGVAATLNRAAEAAGAAFIGQVDSDDLLVKTAVEEAMGCMLAHPAAALVYTDHLIMDDAGRLKGLGARCAIPYSKERLLTDFMTMHFRLVRRAAFLRCGGFDETLEAAVDYDLCLKLSEVGEVCHIPKPLYVYRHHGASISVAKREVQIACARRAIEAALARRRMADSHTIEVDGERFTLRRS